MSASVRRGASALTMRCGHDLGEYVTVACLSQPSDLALLGLGNGSLTAFDTHNGRIQFHVDAHAQGVLGLSLSPDGTHFVSCGQDAHAKLWNVAGSLVRELPGKDSSWVEHAAWSPSGDHIATAAGRKVYVWSKDGTPLFASEALDSTVSGLAWRADGAALAAIAYGGVHIWPFVTRAKPRHLAWKGSLISLAWSPDGKIIACGSQDCSVHFWRLANGQDSEMRGYPYKPKALAWDDESKLLATAGAAQATVWDFRGKGPEGTRPILLDGHSEPITQLAFRPRSSQLASASRDGTVGLWEPRRSKRPTETLALTAEVTVVAWSPSGQSLLAADGAGHVGLWEVA